MAEVAAIVSAALEDSHITATLSGGAAVTIFSDNAYESADLDFVTSESNKVIKETIAKLGFQKHFPLSLRVSINQVVNVRLEISSS